VGVLVVTPPIVGLLNTPVKQELINLTHKTPLRGATPPLEGARLDHFVIASITMVMIIPHTADAIAWAAT